MVLKEAGESAVILSLSYDTTGESVLAVRSLYSSLKRSKLPGVASIVPGLDCILIKLSDDADRATIKEFCNAYTPADQDDIPDKMIEVPVCYEPQFGTDIENVCSIAEIAPETLIQIHTSIEFETWMIGFMPGFPYLGEIPERLRLPRKAVPDPFIPAGSVAIAEEYTGVYPFDSPGGWHVIGRTPWKLVDYSRKNPWLFEYGTRVRFYPITADQYSSTPEYQET